MGTQDNRQTNEGAKDPQTKTRLFLSQASYSKCFPESGGVKTVARKQKQYNNKNKTQTTITKHQTTTKNNQTKKNKTNKQKT